jgi:signal transduction histidine kinase/CheY-like chemotaxis protein
LTFRIRQGARAHAWHLTLLGLVIGLLWAGIGFNLWRDHGAARREAEDDTANLARAFEENITRTVEAADQTLLFLREAYQNDPAGFVKGPWASGHGFLDNLHMQLSLANRDGKVLWSNPGPAPENVNIADRPHFQAQRSSVDDQLVISRPVIGRVSKKWSVQFARKLVATDGSFAGVAVVSLDPAYLSSFYKSISIGNGVIILAALDGTILARAPERGSTTGDTLAPLVRDRILHGATNGSYRAISGLDQVDRIFSSRKLLQYPLMVAVGLAADDVYAPYFRNEQLYLIAGTLLTATSILVGLIMIRQRHSLVVSRQALAATLENMSQGIAMIDADGNVPVMNQKVVDLLGLPPALLATRPTLQTVIDWQFRNGEFGEEATWDPPLAKVLRGTGGPHGNYTYERTRPNGTVLEVRTQGLPDGGIVRTYTDITERKQNEVALAAAQVRAAHAERMQVLGQLAGGIAHDFNNILQAVQGSASLIDKRAADADSVRRFARMILDATGRGTSITRRLLAFARRGELRAEPVDPASLLSGLRDVLSHTLGSPIAVDLRLEPGLPPILADKGQLETVLVNLATNARDAMPGGGTLTFTASGQTIHASGDQSLDLQPGRYVQLSIIDTGSGMDRQTLDRALEPFFSTKPPGQGTGLGLSMAKGFVEQSGGALSIESTPAKGTTVHLWLPATTTPVPPARPVPSSRPEHEDNGRHILLVDDEVMVRETLAVSLEDVGYIVLTAADGAEALDIISSGETVDVLVTDLSMPGIDGLAVIQEARSQRPGLPAVLLTGYAGHGAQLAVGGSLDGAYTLVRKPVTAAQLADRIEALLAVKLPG